MPNEELQTMYNRVASAFAHEITRVFSSEDSLKSYWETRYSMLPFDRTSNWNILLRQMLKDEWEKFGPAVVSGMTQHDVNSILACLHSKLDYNLFTQVLLNLQDMSLLRYRVADAAAERTAIEARWKDAKLNPTVPKAKMFKTAATTEEEDFNRDRSALKAINTIAAFNPSTSFRVTAAGSTPALVDSSNISSMGIGADRFLALPDGFQVLFFDLESMPIPLDVAENGKFTSPGIKYLFESKSGGDILGSVLRSRMAVHSLYSLVTGPSVFLPRMYSVMLIANSELNPHLDLLPGQCNFPVISGGR
jgi:hypothetical protein